MRMVEVIERTMQGFHRGQMFPRRVMDGPCERVQFADEIIMVGVVPVSNPFQVMDQALVAGMDGMDGFIPAGLRQVILMMFLASGFFTGCAGFFPGNIRPRRRGGSIPRGPRIGRRDRCRAAGLGAGRRFCNGLRHGAGMRGFIFHV